MTTTGPALSHDHRTHALSARRPFVVDSLSPLQHRDRERTVSPDGAPPGRYLALEHAGETRLLPLQRALTRIGRGLAADVRLEDALVSRRHAILQVLGDRVRLLDDRSANGTIVNGRPVTAATLTDGDVVRLGRVVFRYTEITPHLAHRPPRRVVPTRRRHACPARLPAAAAA